MPKVTIVVGMPGSGKSEYLKPAKKRGEPIFDDFHGDAIGSSPDFLNSKHHQSLKDALAGGKDCVIADIDYCYEGRLNEAKSGIEKIGKELGIKIDVETVYFENDPAACEANVRRRHRDQMEEEIANIKKRTGVYKPGTPRIPVWKPDGTATTEHKK
jgi:predicted kinase